MRPGAIFLIAPLGILLLGMLYMLYLLRPSGAKNFKIGDRVRLKTDWSLVSEKHPKPDVWVIEDVYKTIGYKIIKEGTCTTVLGPIWDKDLESAEGAPRNEIDIFINDTLRSSTPTVREKE